jgi:hypothetical protein
MKRPNQKRVYFDVFNRAMTANPPPITPPVIAEAKALMIFVHSMSCN